MALVGIGFNIKMLEAYLVLPALVMLYLVAAPRRWPVRIVHLATAGVVLAIVSLSWAVIVDLNPRKSAPVRWIEPAQLRNRACIRVQRRPAPPRDGRTFGGFAASTYYTGRIYLGRGRNRQAGRRYGHGGRRAARRISGDRTRTRSD